VALRDREKLDAGDSLTPVTRDPALLLDDARRFALIFATIQDAVVVTDADARVIDWNPGAEQLFGYTRAEILGRNLSDADVGVIDAALDANVRATTLRAGRWEGELPFTRRNGHHGTLHTISVTSRDEAGQTIGLVSVHRDISERKLADEALRESEKRLRLALEGASEGLWDWHIDTGDVYFSAAAERMLGYEPGEMEARAGGTWDRGVHPDDMPGVQRAIDAHVAGRTPAYEAEYRFRTKQGGWLWILGRGKVVERTADGTPRRMTGIHIDITERKLAEQRADAAVRESEERHRLLFEENPIPLLVIDADTLTFLAVNAAAVRQYGYSHEEFQRMSIADIRPPEDIPLALARAAAPPEVRTKRSGPYRHQRKDGSILLVDIVSRDFVFGTRPARLVLAIDVTEQRHLEDQLRQSQKIEAVGQLAGGIAHDFNNLLTIIKGNIELALHELPHGVPLRSDLEQVANAASRAALLTRQLLAFSRKQVLSPAVLDLNEVVSDAQRMLRRVIGEDITFVTELATAVSRVTADRGQIEQVLVNLVVNARDAMPDGGVLTIATADVDLSPAEASARGIPAGAYVTVRVRDTGIGMDEPTRSRIFEPFFTTKPVGRGTGLGLATVHGVVHQSGGFVTVQSAPGAGSVFTVFLPRSSHIAIAHGPPHTTAIQRGSETILLVEDEDEVRAVARRVLVEAGYGVLEAANAGQAIEVFETARAPIAMLVSDVVMPGLNGRELSQMLRLRDPGLRTLFVSGYSFDARGESKALDDESFLPKPYEPAELARRVRSILDAPAVA
jgi:two-component system cell cycle sensor histidine kinase/response regulator CckA